MVEKFHNELEELKKDVSDMGKLANDMLVKSITALKNQDVELAKWVISKKEVIRVFDQKLEVRALHLTALYQPMAKDMRTIACILKMITYLTRIGRYGKDTARSALEISEKPHIAKLVSIPYMADIVCGMLDNALEAFEKEDLSFLEDFTERDDTVDALRHSIFRECITYMGENPKTITQCAHYIMIARYLERCADHVCKMGEKIHYMVTGEHVEIGYSTDQL
jgi:phosphate transport system protein